MQQIRILASVHSFIRPFVSKMEFDTYGYWKAAEINTCKLFKVYILNDWLSLPCGADKGNNPIISMATVAIRPTATTHHG